MQITHEQANERLSSRTNLANRFAAASVVEIPIRTPRRGPQVSAEIKEEIAIRARAGEGQQALADEYGISQATVHNIEAGKVVVPDVTPAILGIQEIAVKKLMSTLGFIDEDKLSGLGAKDLSTVAANMAKVVSQTTPKDKSDNQVTVHVYVPETRSERSYDIVTV